MKQNPVEKPVRARMQPGVLSRSGFLGRDERPIADIVAADLAELQRAGMGPGEVGDVLDALHAAADAGLGAPQQVADGRLSVCSIEGLGTIPCPFGCGTNLHKGVVHVSWPEGSLHFTPLQGHLIREHGFFQGRGAQFRIEPHGAAALVRLWRAAPDNA